MHIVYGCGLEDSEEEWFFRTVADGKKLVSDNLTCPPPAGQVIQGWQVASHHLLRRVVDGLHLYLAEAAALQMVMQEVKMESLQCRTALSFSALTLKKQNYFLILAMIRQLVCMFTCRI